MREDATGLIDAQTFSVNLGEHNRQLCASRQDCDSKLTFFINLIEPTCPLCHNGGRCSVWYRYGPCKCSLGYSGKHCELLHGRIRVYIETATNLLNINNSGNAQDKSDPQIIVTAINKQGKRSECSSNVIKNSLNPVWTDAILCLLIQN